MPSIRVGRVERHGKRWRYQVYLKGERILRVPPPRRQAWTHPHPSRRRQARRWDLHQAAEEQPRDVLVSASLFLGLGAFDGGVGWLFGGRSVRPRRDRDELTNDSTAGRLVTWLLEHGGRVESPSGRAGADARRAIGTNSATLSQVVARLVARKLLDRDANARRTFRLELTPSGVAAAQALLQAPPAQDLPVHPDAVGHCFEEMIARLELRSATGHPYTLHSLRHYRATHLYNRSKDWVQVARYLGHTSPAITMELYANNVVTPTQALLADSAVCYEDEA